MTEFNFKIEDKQVKRALNKLLNKRDPKSGAPNAGVDAAKDIMFDWWEKAGSGETGAPLDTGNLRASISAGVQGEIISAPPEVGVKVKGTRVPDKRVTRFEKGTPTKIVGVIGANTSYATVVHEKVKRGRISGRGKFIEANARERMPVWRKMLIKRARLNIDPEK